MMRKSKFRCFVIKSRYVCTKDQNLAQVYAWVKRGAQCVDLDEGFEDIVKGVIEALEVFARHRGLLHESLYLEVRAVLTLGYDTCGLSKEDFERGRNTLVDCLYKFQELEEVADRGVPLVLARDEMEDSDLRPGSRELRIRAVHTTRDMSVGNIYTVDYYADVRPFDQKESLVIDLDPLDGGRIVLLPQSENTISLIWGSEQYEVEYPSTVTTKACFIDNPLLSVDTLQLIFSYRSVPSAVELWNRIVAVGYDESQGKVEKHILVDRKREILHFIDKAIGRGYTGLYVPKALLNEYNRWDTCEIDDVKSFQRLLFEGIEQGCLAPDNTCGWEWMEVASRNNDPAVFLEDMEVYYEVLDTAASYGVVEAIDIMNSIWEPEQTVEED